MSLPPEIWCMIAEHVPDGKTWKSFILTCSEFNAMNTKQMVLKHSNPLWTLITRYPDQPWNWDDISANPWTTFEIVERYPDKPYNWAILMQRLKFPDDFLFDMIAVLSDNPIADEYDYNTRSMYVNAMDKIKLLSNNPDIPEEFLRLNHKLLDTCDVSANVNFNTLIRIGCTMCLNHVCFNPTVSFEYLDQNHENINFQFLSENPTIPLWFFQRYLYKDWDFHMLSHNSSITVEYLEVGANEAWDWPVLSDSRDIVRMYQRFPDKPWNYDRLSANSYMTFDMVQKYPDRDWNKSFISENAAISLEQVRANLDWGWNFPGLLLNPYISFDEMIKEFILLDNGLIVHNSLTGSDVLDELRRLTPEDVLDFDETELIGRQDTISFRDLPMSSVLENKLDWDYHMLAGSQRMTWMDIDEHIDEDWDWDSISENFFGRMS